MGMLCSKPGDDDGMTVARSESDRAGFRAGLVRQKTNRTPWMVYTKGDTLGTGHTGSVWACYKRETREPVAIKSIKLNCIDESLLDDLRNEIEILKLVDHPNIIKLLETYEDDVAIYLVLEMCTGGELYDRLLSRPQSRFDEPTAAHLVARMLSAIAYCHRKQISHRDLKLENFVFEDASPGSNLKLIDFGLSRKYGASDGLKRMSTIVGTAYYIAPEVIRGKPYTNKVDIWSLGVVAYMLLSGKPPFAGREDSGIMAKVKKGDYNFHHKVWKKVSPLAIQFCRFMLNVKPGKRPTAEEAMLHPWIQANIERTRRDSDLGKLDKDMLASLREFKSLPQIKRATLEAIAFRMPAKDIANLRAAFTRMDVGEMKEALKAMGIAEDEANDIFDVVNQDQSSYVSYTEFLAATLSKRMYLNKRRLEAAFDTLDVDGSGVITPENLRQVLGDDFTPARVEEMLKEADIRGDGVISREEFMKVMGAEAEAIVERATAPPLHADVVAIRPSGGSGLDEVKEGPEEVDEGDSASGGAGAGAGAGASSAAGAPAGGAGGPAVGPAVMVTPTTPAPPEGATKSLLDGGSGVVSTSEISPTAGDAVAPAAVAEAEAEESTADAAP